MADYMRARYKQSEDVCFLSPDSVGDVSHSSPSSWNKYPYVRGNPINAADPSGNAYAEVFGCGMDAEFGHSCEDSTGGGGLGVGGSIWFGITTGYYEVVGNANCEAVMNDVLRCVDKNGQVTFIFVVSFLGEVRYAVGAYEGLDGKWVGVSGDDLLARLSSVARQSSGEETSTVLPDCGGQALIATGIADACAALGWERSSGSAAERPR